MQLQAANISIVITGGCDAHFGPLCNRGPLLIGISFEEGITNEAI